MPFLYIVILVRVALIIIFLYFIEPLITRQKIKDNKVLKIIGNIIYVINGT